MLAVPPPLHDLSSEHGFSLLELLVAMVAGMVLTFATFSLLELATNQTSRATDYVQASQLGRTAMNHIVDQLNSTCVAENSAPVLGTSTSEALFFVTAFSKKTEIQPSEVQEHEIYWKKTSGEIGSLYDEKWIAESKKNATEWTFKTKAASTVLIDPDIVRYTNPKTGAREIFQYFKYEKEVKSGEISSLQEIQLKSPELGSEASHVAAVTVNFRSLPADKNEKLGRYVDLSSQVTFAFSAGFTEPTVVSTGACQNQ